MLQALLNSNFIKGTKSLGVDLYLNTDGSLDINCVILKQYRNKVSVEKKLTGLKSLKDLNNKDLKGLPISLSIDGRGILFKKLEKRQGSNSLQQLLPNAKETDFYSQHIQSGENSVFISAVRRDVINPLLDELKQNEHFIVQLNIGPFAMANLASIVANNKVLFTNKYKVSFNENGIDSIERINESKFLSFKFGDDEVYNEEMLAYATALDFYIRFSDTSSNDRVNMFKNEFALKKLFTLAGWSVLLFFLAVLLVNSMYFTKYNERLSELSSSFNQNQELFIKLDTLRSELKLKEEYFVNSGFLEASKLSFYADRIAETIPAEIHLTALNINPLVGKVKDDKPVDFSMHKIKITGTVTQSIILNNWVKRLKKIDWIHNITIIDYSQQSAEIPAEFTLEIDIK